MAATVDISEWYVGEDREFAFELLGADGNPIDVATWALSWIARSATPILKTTTNDGIVVEGTYNASRAANTQRVVVKVARADTVARAHSHYHHELARTDAGAWTVLLQGTAKLLPSRHRGVA